MTKLLIALIFFPLHTLAACPKNKKEWQAQGPKLLIQTAAQKITATEIPDFSKELGGKNAQGSVIPFKEKKKEFVIVEAKMPKEALSLSGVMKCDLETKQPVLLSLTWMKGEQSGIAKLGK